MLRFVLAASFVAFAVSTATAQSSRNTRYTDAAFVRDFGRNVQYNIELANSFVTRSPNRELREIALRNAVDQNALRIHLGNAARVNVSPTMSREQRVELNNLQRLQGTTFDRAYLKQAGPNNANVISDVQRAAAQSGSPALRNFAANSLPVLETNKELLKTQR